MLLFAAALQADVYSFADQQGSKVRLFDEPCPQTTGWLKLKKAKVHWQGRDYEACWAIVKTFVLIFDESGDVAAVPVQAFTKERVI